MATNIRYRGQVSVPSTDRSESDFWQYIDAVKEFVEKD